MSYHAELELAHSPNPGSARRILIVGGVAGGASCAARLRRLDESVEIVIFDRGPYVAFANCGLPYYVGDVISDERTLLVASPEMFRERFNIWVHTNTTNPLTCLWKRRPQQRELEPESTPNPQKMRFG